MKIESNTKGKIQKILNGTVFGDQYTFITEFLQNAQRSRAKNIMFDTDINDGCLVVSDDGCGCKDPSNVFTLDLSDWESTDEGFGIGFWSCLCLNGLQRIEVESKGWKCTVYVEDLRNGKLDVSTTSSEVHTGFCVSLFASKEAISALDEELWEILSEKAQFMQLSVYSNGKKVERKNILDTLELGSGNLYDEEFHNNFFDARLATTEYVYDYITFYYEDRKVASVSTGYNLKGIVNIKTGKATLKEPDREEFVKDNKYYRLMDKIQECGKKLYQDAIGEYGDDDKIARGAANYLSEREIVKYLKFDDFNLEGVRSDLEKELMFEMPEEKETVEKPQRIAAKVSSQKIDVEQHKEKDQVIVQDFRSHVQEKKASTENGDAIKRIRRVKMAVWVDSNETSYYQDDIAKANYCGVSVFEAKNEMYSKVMKKLKIHHISCLASLLSETFIKKNVELKTQKEQAFIQWLTPIVKHFNLPDDVFMIADLSHEVHFITEERTIVKINKNEEGNVVLKGITDGNKIYLDRTMLGLRKQKLNVSGFIGGNEMRTIMRAMTTIAHELAHYLYDTTDNTTRHFAAIERLIEEIAMLY